MTHDHFRKRLLQEAGVEGLPDWKVPHSFDELAKTQWSKEFEQAMRVRLLMGAFRYSPFKHQGRGTHKNVESAIRRLKRYLKDGNQEDLVDAANMCLVEFMCPGSHPNPHWHAVDDGEEHVEVNK
jgi:hypothetical protein